jgi:hypothetical protein
MGAKAAPKKTVETTAAQPANLPAAPLEIPLVVIEV